MADRLTAEQEERLRQAEAKATAGPWIDWSHEGQTATGRHRYSICRLDEDGQHRDCIGELNGATESEAAWNAFFAILARNTMPALLEELTALRTDKSTIAKWLRTVVEAATNQPTARDAVDVMLAHVKRALAIAEATEPHEADNG